MFFCNEEYKITRIFDKPTGFGLGCVGGLKSARATIAHTQREGNDRAIIYIKNPSSWR